MRFTSLQLRSAAKVYIHKLPVYTLNEYCKEKVSEAKALHTTKARRRDWKLFKNHYCNTGYIGIEHTEYCGKQHGPERGYYNDEHHRVEWESNLVGGKRHGPGRHYYNDSHHRVGYEENWVNGIILNASYIENTEEHKKIN